MEGTRLTGLWKNTGKDGKAYLAGSVSATARLLIFPNEKRNPKEPDYLAYLAPAEKKQSTPQPAADDAF